MGLVVAEERPSFLLVVLEVVVGTPGGPGRWWRNTSLNWRRWWYSWWAWWWREERPSFLLVVLEVVVELLVVLEVVEEYQS